MKYCHLLAVFILLLVILGNGNAQTFTDSFPHQTYVRHFRIHLPAGYDPSVAYPLILSYHGYTSNALQQELYTGMSALADEQQFIVVYPDGIGNAWNVGFVPQPYFSGVDDVGFTNTLLDTLMARYTIDAGKVYACGMSNGGYMSYRLACELSDRITAIASVTGLMTDSTAHYCNPSRSVPVLQIHGTADPIVNYNGFPGSLSVETTLSLWQYKNNCTNQTTTNPLPNTNTLDLSTVEQIDYTGCNSCAFIRFYKVNNGGHTWPDGAIDIPAYGTTNRDMNATREIWNFFQMHSTPCFAGLDEEITSEISVFPNPGTNILQITSEKPIERITLLDMAGRQVLQTSQPTITVDHVKEGMYLLIVETFQHTARISWIKSN